MENTPPARHPVGSGAVAHSKPPGAWITIWLTGAGQAGKLQMKILDSVRALGCVGTDEVRAVLAKQVTTAASRLRDSRWVSSGEKRRLRPGAENAMLRSSRFDVKTSLQKGSVESVRRTHSTNYVSNS